MWDQGGSWGYGFTIYGSGLVMKVSLQTGKIAPARSCKAEFEVIIHRNLWEVGSGLGD